MMTVINILMQYVGMAQFYILHTNPVTAPIAEQVYYMLYDLLEILK